MNNIQIYTKRPADFSPFCEVAAIYVNLNGKVLFLRLANRKTESGRWGVPAGKMEANETALKGAQRELFEEAGIQVDADLFVNEGILFFRKTEMDYVYHLFGVNLNQEPNIQLSDEHVSHQWVSREEAAHLPLMGGAIEALDYFYKNKDIS